MWNSKASGGDGDLAPDDVALRRYFVAASVNDDLIAAVEGWRRAHGVAEQPEALGELVRLGLMSEVAKIYRLVCQDGRSEATPGDGHRKPKRSKRWERKEAGVSAS